MGIEIGGMRKQVKIWEEAHEVEMQKEDAAGLGLSLSLLMPLIWRNWRRNGRKLEMIPPYPKPPEKK